MEGRFSGETYIRIEGRFRGHTGARILKQEKKLYIHGGQREQVRLVTQLEKCLKVCLLFLINMVALKRAIGFSIHHRCDAKCLSTFSTDTTGQLDVLGHDGDTFGVDGAKVGVLEETDQVSFAGFLEGHDGGTLESEFGLEVLGNFPHQTLKWQLADEKFCALLVTTDLTESYSAGPVTMGFLDSPGGWGTFPGSLGGQLFARSLSSG